MNVFFNSTELRARAFWRILAVNGAILFSMILVQLLLSLNSVLFPIVSAVMVFAIIGTVGVKLDQRKVADYGLALSRSHLKDTALGLAVALLVMTILFTGAYLFGWINIKAHVFDGSFLSSNRVLNHLAYVAVMLAVGFYEEWWNRGYVLLNLKEGFDLTPSQEHERNLIGKTMSGPIIAAVILSSAFFSFLHLGNPNVNTFATLNIFLAGVMLALPFILTGRLGFSVGVHIGWNYAQGGIFGWAVSGTLTKGNLIAVDQLTAFEHIHGGAFGPEGGILGTVGIILVMIFSLWWGLTKRSERKL